MKKRCINCGEPLPEDAKFCNKCRAKQPEKVAAQPENAKPDSGLNPETIEIAPESAKYFYERGRDHHFNGDNDTAVKELTKAIQYNDNHYNAKVLALRGQIYYEKGNYDTALGDLNSVCL